MRRRVALALALSSVLVAAPSRAQSNSLAALGLSSGGTLGGVALLGGAVTSSIALAQWSNGDEVGAGMRTATGVFGGVNLLAGGLLVGFGASARGSERTVLLVVGGVFLAVGLLGAATAIASGASGP